MAVIPHQRRRATLPPARGGCCRGRVAFLAAAAALTLLAAGCGRTAVVRGAVTDVSGEDLPGVAVAVPGTPLQGVSNRQGRYWLRCAPGNLKLTFIKTGYTTGHLRVTVPGPGPMDVEPVTLWPLPPGKGVYVFTPEFRYHELTRAKPKQYIGKEIGPCFGVKTAPTLVFEDPEPLFIAFRMPPYDIQMRRLQRIAAARPQAAATPAELPEKAFFETVWVPGKRLSAHLAPIDEPERLLYELRLPALLEPGVYAVHWGALDGHRQPGEAGQNVFLFRVRGEGEQAPAEGETEGEAEGGGAAEPDADAAAG